MNDQTLAARLGPNASARLLQLAAIALSAGALSLDLRPGRRSGLVEKGPRDYQTAADVAVERHIVNAIRAAFPDYAIWGEEQVGNREVSNAPQVLIDPIDGTTNYLWGIPHFSIVISIREQGEIVAGITYDPNLDELFSAEKGGGAFLNGERIGIRTPQSPQHALVGAGTPVPGQVKSVPVETYHQALRRLMDTTSGMRRLGSAALSLAYTACGRLDGFFEDGLSPLDYGASVLIVREAGGIVTGFDGGSIPGSGAILAASPALHPWLVDGFTSAARPSGSSVVT
jgi:myo-inositol-1(or 4)-monophosphatase